MRSTVMYLMIPLKSYKKCYLKVRSLSDQANLFWRESVRRNHWNCQNDEGDWGSKEPSTWLINHIDTSDQLKMTTTIMTRMMNWQTNRQTDRQTDKHLPSQFHNFTISLSHYWWLYLLEWVISLKRSFNFCSHWIQFLSAASAISSAVRVFRSDWVSDFSAQLTFTAFIAVYNLISVSWASSSASEVRV